MLLILIVALIATGAFFRQAQLAGLHPGKAASLPFIAGALVLGLVYLGRVGIDKSANAVNAAAFTTNAIRFMLNAFALLTYLVVIRRTWRGISRAAQLRKLDKEIHPHEESPYLN